MSVGPAGDGNLSVASGNSVCPPISTAVDVCGNAVANLGFAAAGCEGGAAVFPDSPITTTNDNYGLIP